MKDSRKDDDMHTNISNGYELDLGDVILIANKIYFSCRFFDTRLRTQYFLLKDNLNTIYTMNQDIFKENYMLSELDKEILNSKNFNVINLPNEVKRLLQSTIDKELKEFIKSKIDDYDYLYKDFRNVLGAFTNQYGKDYLKNENLNSYNQVIKLAQNIDYNNLHKKEITINDNIKIDLQDFSIKEYNKKLIDIFYTEYDRKMLIISERYKEGKVPNYYKHIAKINQFLEGKESVKVILKNNRKYTVECKDLIVFHDNDFYFNDFDLYYEKVSEAKEIQYKNETLKIDTESLDMSKSIQKREIDIFIDFDSMGT